MIASMKNIILQILADIEIWQADNVEISGKRLLYEINRSFKYIQNEAGSARGVCNMGRDGK